MTHTKLTMTQSELRPKPDTRMASDHYTPARGETDHCFTSTKPTDHYTPNANTDQ